ncbi:HAMP domain-containing sensor histidine kinase [Veillonella criceti]|uniref:histidine kinase n=2 Tax=Veillonella criceti TaxID=103891 RepID=A0A380NI38_9FIRM|nr:HAMP domain-containing sensor histidine kinase [Veillonella criceti]SUP41642.1 Signal transduction histidine-protein kinase BaeS [Veillonella criceti]
MTIKRRLTISNFLMIGIPVLIALIISFFTITALWVPIVQENNIGVRDLDDFEKTSSFLLTQIEGKLKETSAQGRDPKLSDVGSSLRLLTGYTVYIEDSEHKMWGWGEEPDVYTNQLQELAMQLKENGIVSVGTHAVALRDIQTLHGNYRVYIFGSEIHPHVWPAKNTVKWTLIFIFCVVVVGILMANRLLTRFVFHRIRSALDLLAKGVRQIRDGNLEVKLSYTGKDEFAPICDDFNDMAQRLKESVELIQKQENNRKELLAGISHDLRSPLTSIKAYAEGIQDGIATTPELEAKYIRMIQTKADEMERMISNLFTFSKMEMEEYPNYPEEVDLGQEIINFVRNEGVSYGNKGLYVSYRLVGDTFKIWADPFQIRHILMNLADNSVKYKTNDMGHLQIVCEQQNDVVIVCVADDGPGTTASNLERLFDVFYRDDMARSNPHKGSGLGLAIVKKMVQQMKGSINAAQVEPHGLQIVMRIPRYTKADNH